MRLSRPSSAETLYTSSRPLCVGICRSHPPESLHQEEQGREDWVPEESGDSQVLCQGEESPSGDVERKECERRQDPSGRCRHRCHLQFRGRHQERSTCPRLLTAAQIEVRKLWKLTENAYLSTPSLRDVSRSLLTPMWHIVPDPMCRPHV